MKKFTPDIYVNKVTDIPINFFKEKGIKLIFTDIDNTLAPHDSQVPMAGAIEWMEKVKATGVKFIALSNNREERVKPFAERYGMEYIFYADKPKIAKMMQKVIENNLNLPSCCIIGDQIFTDLLTAKNAHVLSVLVKPQFKDFKRSIVIKRFFEKPFVKHLKYTVF